MSVSEIERILLSASPYATLASQRNRWNPPIMIAKQIIRAILLVVALGALAIWANSAYRKSQGAGLGGPKTDDPAAVPGHQVVMTYFISGERCENCRKIEALAQETVAREFAADEAAKRVVFRVVDTGAPGQAHFVKDYQLTEKMVVLCHRVDGKETEWRAMEKIWDLLDDPDGFRNYLAEGIRGYLKR